TLWENRATMHHSQLTEAAKPGQQAFDHTMNALQNGLGMSHQQALSMVDGLINTQAFTMSAVDVFYASAIIFLMLTGLVWFARPRSSKAGGGGAAEAAAGAH
ncbi:MAG: MFS transporter, partial [Alcaligenes sp.]